MRTWPRDSGRSWQTDSVKPEHGCTLPPGHVGRQRGDVELDVGRRAPRRGSARMKQPPWLMPIASGPLRCSSHCRPMAALPNQRVELVVGGDRLACIRSPAGPAGGPAGSRRRRARRARRGCRAARSSARGPMPESCSSCGDWIAPADEQHLGARSAPSSSRRPAGSARRRRGGLRSRCRRRSASVSIAQVGAARAGVR